MKVTSEHIAHLSGDVLLALARNEAAQMRKAAVEIMLEKGYKQVNHPEIAGMVAEVRKEREARMEVESIVESAIESELPEGTGPLVASVTTATMQQPTIIRNAGKLNEDALSENEQHLRSPYGDDKKTGTQKLNDWIKEVEAGQPIVVTHPSVDKEKSEFIEQYFPAPGTYEVSTETDPLHVSQADELPQASD